MTPQFKNMLCLFGANANGAEIKLSEKPDVDKIREFSLTQGIWTMVYPELEKVCDVSRYRQEFFTVVSRAISQREFTQNIIRKLEENGILCCLLKGAVLSRIYADPQCRISSDTDILINPSDEKKSAQLLQTFGYTVEPRPKNDHHFKAYHQRGGLLEVHITLYSNVTSAILFNGINMYAEAWHTIDIDGADFHTLGINDNLMYLTAHYIKHFINSGGGVRQMMDLLLYIEKYKNEIDFERYDRLLKELKYDKLIETVKSIGGKYFGFSYEIKNEELMNKLLTDTEIGGIFGHQAKNRGGFYNEYCKKRSTMPVAKSKLYLFFNKEGGCKIFPSRELLINNYGYAYARHKLLVPLAWMHRFSDILTGRRKKTVAPKDTTEFTDRMNLITALGMVEKE